MRNARRVDDMDRNILFLTYHAHVDIKHVMRRVTQMSSAPSTISYDDLDPLFLEINRMVRDIQEKHSTAIWLYDIWSFSTIFMWMAMMVYGSMYRWSGYFPAIYIFTYVTVSFNWFHTRIHRGHVLMKSFCHWLKPVFDWIDNSFFRPIDYWNQNHQLSHHIHTNSEKDHDYTRLDLLRLSGSTPWRWYNLFQVGPLCIGTSIGNSFIGVLGRILKYEKHMGWKLFNGGILCLVSYLHAYNSSSYPQFTFAVYGVSFIMSILFLISHNNMDIHESTPNKINPASYQQFVRNQCDHTVSWGGLVACVLYGGINYQVEHHVVPAASPLVYHYMQPQMKELLGSYGIPYHYHPSVANPLGDFAWIVLKNSVP
jgi:fatty acid desaturase